MTPQQVKDNIDIEITSKTLQNSITPTNVGKNMKDIIDLIPSAVSGPTGPQGIQGIQGPIGLTGPQGPAGQNGTNGINATANNLQKIITSNYTLTPADNNYVIFVNNGVNNVTIDLGNNLPNNFNCGFVQEGTGNVNFVSPTPLLNAQNQFKIKGQYYNVFIERRMGFAEVYLFGNTKA